MICGATYRMKKNLFFGFAGQVEISVRFLPVKYCKYLVDL